MTQHDFHYQAFISYSHRDKRWGDWLHRALETYRVPRRLVGQQGRDGVIPPRIVPVFRDREELPTSSDLGSTISDALAKSRMLIVVCSPRSAQSHWVNEEIITFKKLGGAGRILCLIVDGEPNASDKPQGQSLECFPPALRFELDDDGTLSERRSEPIAADARPTGDGKPNAKLKLVAGILGVGFDDLKQRELQRRNRRLMITAASAMVALAFAVTLTVFALISRSQAVDARMEADQQKQRAEAGERETRTLLINSRITNGWRQQEDGDMSGNLLWQADALRLMESVPVSESQSSSESLVIDEHRARLARIRLGFLNRRHPAIAAAFSHEEPITDAVFSPDGQMVATGGDGGLARVWRAHSGEPVTDWLPCIGEVKSLAFNADGSLLAISDDTGVRVWQVKSGEAKTPRFAVDKLPYGIAFASNGRLLLREQDGITSWDIQSDPPQRVVIAPPNVSQFYVMSQDRRYFAAYAANWAMVYDAVEGKAVTVAMMHQDFVKTAAFSGDGKLLATGTQNGAVLFWSIETGKPLNAGINHRATIGQITFSADNQSVAVASHNGFVARWSVNDPSRPIWYRQERGTGWNATFSPDEKWILARVAETGFLLRADTGHAAARWSLQGEDPVFSDDGKRILVRDYNGIAKVWHLPQTIETPEPQLDVRSENDEVPAGAAPVNVDVDSIRFSPDGDKLLAGTTGGALWIGEKLEGRWKLRRVAQVPADQHAGGHSAAVQWHPDGRRVFGAFDNIASLVNSQPGRQPNRPEPFLQITLDPKDYIFGAAFNPAGDHVLLGSSGGVWWNLSENKSVAVLGGGEVGTYVGVSGDGKTLVTAGNHHDNTVPGKIRFWNPDGTTRWPDIDEVGRVFGVLFAPDGQTFAVGNNKGVSLYDASTGKHVSTIKTIHTNHSPQVFSKDGQTLITLSVDGFAHVWDVQAGIEKLPALPHERLRKVSFSRDESMIVTAGYRTALIWDAWTGQRVTAPVEYAREVWDADISPDATELLVGAGPLSVHSLLPATESAGRLMLQAELWSGRTVDSNGAAKPLTRTEWLERWQKLNTSK